MIGFAQVLPKPRISIFSPRLIDCSRQPKTASTSSSARAQGNLSLLAMMVMRSALVMDTIWLLHSSAIFTRSWATSPTTGYTSLPATGSNAYWLGGVPKHRVVILQEHRLNDVAWMASEIVLIDFHGAKVEQDVAVRTDNDQVAGNVGPTVLTAERLQMVALRISRSIGQFETKVTTAGTDLHGGA